MENAVEALKIAFAIFVFVIAITVTFSVISQAKSTADYVLFYSDETNFYENLNSKEKNRLVSLSEVISILYRYYDESISVTVDLNGTKYIFDNGNETIIKSNGTIDTSSSTKLNTNEAKEQNLKNFINNVLLKYSNPTFIEQFAEAPIGGIYETGEDGSEIPLTSGNKKVYITYKLQ